MNIGCNVSTQVCIKEEKNLYLLPEKEEIALINRALSGDQKAYEKLYESYVEILFRFLAQFSDQREQVKDWTQVAFVKAFDNLDSFKFNSRFKTWLFSIGLNVMRSEMRSKITFTDLEEANLDKQEPEHSTSHDWSLLRKAIRKLSPEKRMILLLHEVEGYSHNEIGSMLNIKEGTSRVILHRTKEELRKQQLV